MKVQKQFDGYWQAEINAKMMLEFVSRTSAVGVRILLAVGDSVLVNALNFERIFFFRFRQPIKSVGYQNDSQ